MTVSATQLQHLVQPADRQDGEPPVLVVDCPECWFPGGALVAGEAVAVTVADAHDRAAHGGRSTAVIRAPFEEPVADGSDPGPMTAGATAIDWAVREAATELLLGEEVPTARLVRLVEADSARPCVSGDPEDWFPVHETPERAEALCSGCRVVELCRELAMRRPEQGIWGGTTTAERQNTRRRQLRSPHARQAAPVSGDGTAA